MRYELASLLLLGACCRGDLSIEYTKEKGDAPKFEMHVDFSAEDASITIPAPTTDQVIKKSFYTF